MELFTMSRGFLPEKPVDGYNSAIWTERFFTAGDIEILCPLESKFMDLLPPGTLLGHGSSREVAVVENHEIEDGQLKVSGPMLTEALLKNRMAWFRNTEGTEEGMSSTAEFKQTGVPGTMISTVVDDMVISHTPWISWGVANLDWARDRIPRLSLGYISTAGLSRPRTFPLGLLYEGLQQFAQSMGMGFRIYVAEANEAGYRLVFSAWHGRDLTSRQSVNPLVRLSPKMNSLVGTKEVRSFAEYKNVCYVYYKNVIYTYYAEPALPVPTGFDRKVMVRDATGDPPPGELTAYLAQHAADAFANNNIIQAIDGQASIPSRYRYQKDYRLGDIIELESTLGTLAKARVTEYIRAEDPNGDQEYPTVSIIDPLDSGNWPDTDDDWDDDWDDPDPDDDDDDDDTEPHDKPYPKKKKKDKPTVHPPTDPPDDPDPPPDPLDPPPPDPPVDWPEPNGSSPAIWTPIAQYEWSLDAAIQGIKVIDDETGHPTAEAQGSIPQAIGSLAIPFDDRDYRAISHIEVSAMTVEGDWVTNYCDVQVIAYQGSPAFSGWGDPDTPPWWTLQLDSQPNIAQAVGSTDDLPFDNYQPLDFTHADLIMGHAPDAPSIEIGGAWNVVMFFTGFAGWSAPEESPPFSPSPVPPMFTVSGSCITRLYMREE